MAKLTESYLRNMIKKMISEMYDEPEPEFSGLKDVSFIGGKQPPAEKYHTPETAHLSISTLAEDLGYAIENEDYKQILEILGNILNSDTLTTEDDKQIRNLLNNPTISLIELADETYRILWHDTGSIQTRSDFVKSAPNMGRMQESRKRK